MIGANGFVLPEQIVAILPKICRSFIMGEGSVQYLADGSIMGFIEMTLIFVAAFFITIVCKNTSHMSITQKKVVFSLTIAFTIQHMFFTQTVSQFIYFRF